MFHRYLQLATESLDLDVGLLGRADREPELPHFERDQNTGERAVH
jgi:hypothetical protein